MTQLRDGVECNIATPEEAMKPYALPAMVAMLHLRAKKPRYFGCIAYNGLIFYLFNASLGSPEMLIVCTDSESCQVLAVSHYSGHYGRLVVYRGRLCILGYYVHVVRVVPSQSLYKYDVEISFLEITHSTVSAVTEPPTLVGVATICGERRVARYGAWVGETLECEFDAPTPSSGSIVTLAVDTEDRAIVSIYARCEWVSIIRFDPDFSRQEKIGLDPGYETRYIVSDAEGRVWALVGNKRKDLLVVPSRAIRVA